MRLRRATLRDLDTLVAHRRGMWDDIGGYTDADLDAADQVYRRWARARLASGRLVGWIAEIRGEPAGSGCVWVQRVQPRPRHPTGLTPYLMSMYTAPHHRGRGIAARIVGEARHWAKTEGYPRMTLHAALMGRAIYERAGYERTWEMAMALGK